MLGPRSMGAGTASPRYRAAAALPSDGVDYFNLKSRNSRPPFSGSGDNNDGNERIPARESNLEHRTSDAKRLIDQYERMSTPPPLSETTVPLTRNKSTYNRQYVYNSKATSIARNGYLATPERDDKRRLLGGKIDKGKERSPIRQSLQNLLSVIKKGAGGMKRRKSDDKIGVPYGTMPRGGAGSGIVSGNGATYLEDSSNVPNQQQQPATQTPTRSQKKMVGSLLYLTRVIPADKLTQLPSPIDISLSTDTPGIGQIAWTTCSVTLDTNKLVLSSFTAEMHLVVHEISLAGCTDIRSLSASQLAMEEAQMLEECNLRMDGEKGGLKAFELRFKGRAKERFAAKSVRERAGWISAIWDAILPDHEVKKAHIPEMESLNSTLEKNQSSQPRPIQSPMPQHVPQMSPLLNSSYSNRSLPPLPPELAIPPPMSPLSIPEKETKRPPNLHLDIPPLPSPISPSIYPPTSQASSSAGTPFETPMREYFSQFSSKPTSPSTLQGGHPLSLASSTYSATSRPASVFGPTSPTNSPSIVNLSQLSMVRQRLAQIERNHSQISAQSQSRSEFSELAASRPSTPVRTPGSASTSSGWPRRDAILQNGRTWSPLSTPKATSFSTNETNMIPPTRRKGRRKESVLNPSPDDHDKPYQMKHRDRRDKYTEMSNAVELLKGVTDIKGVLGGESGNPTIHQVVVGIEDRIREDGKVLKTIKQKIDQLGELTANATNATNSGSRSCDAGAAANETQEMVLSAIKDIKTQLATDFPALSSKIQEVRAAQENEKTKEILYNSIAPSATLASNAKPIDLQLVLNKIEGLEVLLDAGRNEQKEGGSKEDTKPSGHLDKILSLIQENSNKQTLLSQHQADSVRYLNELNSWLESFVNNGTSQIQGLSVGVDQLCKSLGCNPEMSGVLPECGAPNLLNDIRQLILGMQARDQNFAALQAAVHSLLEVLTTSQTQMGADSQAITGLINQQRRDQEVLFRTFTNEISGEIKGERLRFVEAMKEATAINVQAHVEHFKQELTREVIAMTEEVGRLHQEKLIVENQISDLFAFYSKHKQELALQPMQMHVEHTPARESPDRNRSRANIPRSPHYRPLPHPRHT